MANANLSPHQAHSKRRQLCPGRGDYPVANLASRYISIPLAAVDGGTRSPIPDIETRLPFRCGASLTQTAPVRSSKGFTHVSPHQRFLPKVRKIGNALDHRKASEQARARASFRSLRELRSR